MKKLLFLLTLAIISVATATSQEVVPPRKPYPTISGMPGYVTINELHGAYGLRDTSAPKSHYIYGFTTVHSYFINSDFTVGGGTGASFYDDGFLLPLFLDVRYNFIHGRYVGFLFGNGGFLFDFNDINSGTRLFVNAGPGVRYATSSTLAYNLSTGLLIQMGESSRNSFINLKLGITFKPKK